jgi:hypothetical protein
MRPLSNLEPAARSTPRTGRLPNAFSQAAPSRTEQAEPCAELTALIGHTAGDRFFEASQNFCASIQDRHDSAACRHPLSITRKARLGGRKPITTYARDAW